MVFKSSMDSQCVQNLPHFTLEVKYFHKPDNKIKAWEELDKLR